MKNDCSSKNIYKKRNVKNKQISEFCKLKLDCEWSLFSFLKCGPISSQVHEDRDDAFKSQ